MTHFVSKSCKGELCVVCGRRATHKVGEEIPGDDPQPARHNFTAYVCCEHFRAIMGPAVACEPLASPRSLPVPPGASADLLTRLSIAQLGACTCLTKTPDPDYHAPQCLYRLLCDAAEHIRTQRPAPREIGPQVIAFQPEDLGEPLAISPELPKLTDGTTVFPPSPVGKSLAATAITPAKMSVEQMLARIRLLSDEMDANEEENRGYQDEITALYARIDALKGSAASWNSPDVRPPRPGEYQAALSPDDAADTVRRWWSGYGWSNPYQVDTPADVKARIRREISALTVFWREV